MERVDENSAFALGRVNLSRVPVNRLSALARYGQLSKAQTAERAPEPRRTALLAQLTRGLDSARRQMADRLEEAGDDARVEIVVPDRRTRPPVGGQARRRGRTRSR